MTLVRIRIPRQDAVASIERESEKGMHFSITRPASSDLLNLVPSDPNDECIVWCYDPSDTSDFIVVRFSSTLTVTTSGATGAGGLDTGILVTGGYYIYVICNDDASLISMICSTTDDLASVTLPGSYTRISRPVYFMRVTNISTDTIAPFECVGPNAHGCVYTPGLTVLNSGSATVQTNISVSGYVPEFAGSFLTRFQINNTSATQRVCTFRDGNNNALYVASSSASEGSKQMQTQVPLPDSTLATALDYNWNGSVTGSTAFAVIHGWFKRVH